MDRETMRYVAVLENFERLRGLPILQSACPDVVPQVARLLSERATEDSQGEPDRRQIGRCVAVYEKRPGQRSVAVLQSEDPEVVREAVQILTERAQRPLGDLAGVPAFEG